MDEAKELHRILPYKIWTDLRDKYGHITVLFVPHLGNTKMAKRIFEEDRTNPKRFRKLIMMLSEELEYLKYKLSLAEKRTVHVNYIWDLQGFQWWWTDYYTWAHKFLGPAIKEVQASHAVDPEHHTYIVNTSTFIPWFLNDYKGNVSDMFV